MFNLETNTIVESCDVTFDKTALCRHDVFECAGDKEMQDSIFVDQELHGFNCDEDEPLLPFTLSPSLFLLPHLNERFLRLLPLSQWQWRRHGWGGGIISEQRAPSHVQKAHPPQQIIGNLNERVTRSSRSVHLSCFTNTLFVALFEPRDVGHALFDSSWVNDVHEELGNFERNQVLTLVEPHHDVNVIGTKLVFKNKHRRMVRL
jgi:hypothetical protein